MNNTLREQFFTAMMRYKKIETNFSSECEIQMNELAILKIITGQCACSGCDGINLNVPNIQEKLWISKPAVSYILNALEKKAYIMREIDSKDRRKISITATPAGTMAAEKSSKKYDDIWNRILGEFGEADMQKLVELLSRLTDIFEIMQSED